MKKKRRQQHSAAEVAGAIQQKLVEQQSVPGPGRGSPAESPDAGTAMPTAARAWKWARRVVLGYDRRP